MNIREWILKSVLENKFFHDEFKKNKPFPHLVIDDFLQKEKLSNLKESILKQDFYEEDHDLYQFHRTEDLNDSEDENILSFRDFLLSSDMLELIKSITNQNVSNEMIELHSLRMRETHYLLCHDDQVEGRKIAFILYLSEEFKEEDGGRLELFDCENGRAKSIVKKIIPKANQFVIFEVNDNSFHQISEVLSNKERLSISGWYYEN